MIIMYITYNNGLVKDQDLVSEEEIIALVFSVAPDVVKSSILRYDFSNYVNSIPEHINGIILSGIMDNFGHIIEEHFIEVIEHTSFDYEYGSICGTQYEDVTMGYVPRTPEYEELAYEDWEEDYYW